jgi:hypothetical protein
MSTDNHNAGGPKEFCYPLQGPTLHKLPPTEGCVHFRYDPRSKRCLECGRSKMDILRAAGELTEADESHVVPQQ